MQTDFDLWERDMTQTIYDQELEQLIANLKAETLDSTQLATLPKVEPLIHGIYGRHSLVIIAGRKGSHKTSVALDWSCCHATGTPWLGQAVAETGKVLYLAGEGAYGLNDRKTAWELHHGITVPAGMLTILPRVPKMFRNPFEVKALTELIKRGEYTIVVIDTLRRASGNASQNANDDMGEVIDAIEDIKRATKNGSVLIAAHTDGEDNKVRGATNIEDDVDVVYRLRRTGESDDSVKLWRTKNKYGPEECIHYLRKKVVGNGVVVDRDLGLTLRITDRDAAEAKQLFDFMFARDSTFKGASNLKGSGVDNNKISAGLHWLEGNGYIEIQDMTKPHTYKRLKEWSQG